MSGHHAGFNQWVKMRHADKDPKPIGESPETGLPIYNQDEVRAWRLLRSHYANNGKNMGRTTKGRTKVIFLTATPLATLKH